MAKKSRKELRDEALQRLSRRRSVLPTTATADQLLEELQIHQIELEMQHEELQRTKDALQRSHDEYEELFAHAPSGAIVLDKAFRVERANDYARAVLGSLPPKTSMLSLVPSEIAGEVATWLKGLGAQVNERDLQMIGADGSEVTVLMSARVAISGGTFLGFSDVTDRRKHQQALVRSEGDLRRLADLAPDAVCVCDAGVLIYSNVRFQELVGKPQERVQGSHLVDFAHPDEREQLESWLLEATSAPPERLRMPSAEGGDQLLELRTMRIQFMRKACVLIIARDLTERRRMEARIAQAERMATVGMLVAGVAHEINNPMAFTVSGLEVLVQGLGAGGYDPEELKAAAEDALVGAQRVQSIISDLRAFQHAEDEMSAVVPNTVIAHALRLAEPEIMPRARIRRDLGNVPPVRANENRLIQILLNLMLNAAQAMTEEAPDNNWVRVRSWLAASEVCIAVEDNGPGISEEYRAHIFDPFFTTRRGKGGTGLGLAICNSLVQQMGGFIAVDSTLGEGTRFVIHLPLADGATAERVSSLPPPELAVQGRPLRLLVVDDETGIIRSIGRLLRDVATICAAASGEEAIRFLESDNDFDAILCDLVMRSGTGHDVAAWLTRHRPEVAKRLVFMTGMTHPDLPSIERFDVLHKPFSKKELEAAIAQAIQRGDAREQAPALAPISGEDDVTSGAET